MAITSTHYDLFKSIRDSEYKYELPLGGSLLEIGEQNWYGDFSIERLLEDADQYCEKKYSKNVKKILSELSKTYKSHSKLHPDDLFSIAKVWYKIFLQIKNISSIDLHGTEKSISLDLNYPHTLNKQYDYITNFGTAEHIFNIYQVFQNIHMWTKPGGVMIHGLPMTGEIDHGFYNFHPTFLYDLAAANSYETSLIVLSENKTKQIIPFNSRREFSFYILESTPTNNSSVFCFLTKSKIESQFKIPRQGYYDDKSKDEIGDFWKKQRHKSHNLN